MNSPTVGTTAPFEDAFREAMSAVCTPVSVVTGMSGERPHGTTVSAFMSLSLEPPMILVSLDKGSVLLAIIREAGRFGLNVLATEQAALATTFARKGTDKFDGVDWERVHSVPRLPDAVGFLACTVADLIDGGDHVIVLGHVLGAEAAHGQPLTYYRRRFGTHNSLPVTNG
jgi:flavin reductase (DIM6/NTAB) family NADH-FMN oxidoreductase RutF